MKLNPKSGILALLIIGVLGFAGFAVVNNDTAPSPERQELPIENQTGLEDDKESVNTIVYGIRTSQEARIYAVNDSGKNDTIVSTLKPDVKFITPLANGRQLLYIADTNEGDIGDTFEIKTISSDEEGREIYRPIDDYGIDRYVISENNEWIAWYEVKPEEDEYTHTRDYFRVYKADLGKVLTGKKDILEPILLQDIKGAPDVQLNVPAIVSDSGEVYFDALIPNNYALYYGFKNEQGKEILPINTYNSSPFLFDGNNLLYTAFDPNNQKLEPQKGTNTRFEILNTNTVKAKSMGSDQIVTVGNGTGGEQYKHPVYVDGSIGGKLSFVAEVYSIAGSGEEETLTPQEIQLVNKNADGTFSKAKIFDTADGNKYRILTVGNKPNSSRTVLIGEETSYRGNLGTGVGVGPSGYKNQITNIRTVDLSSGEGTTIKSAVSSEFEFIAVVLKTPAEKIGIDRNKELADEVAVSQEQLQLDTFVPIEPKRERSNPRSDCVKEWQEKGYPNYEACEACPLYIYNDNIVDSIKIVPKTPLAKDSASPNLDNNSWNFTADKNGKLTFSSGQYSKIDYIFPRGKVDMPKEGIVVTLSSMNERIAEYSYSLGFNTQETKDIVAHFREELGDFKYAFISTLSEEKARDLVDFEVYPQPKVIKNIMFYAKKYDSLSNIESKVITTLSDKSFSRSDYTVVAWGSVIE